MTKIYVGVTGLHITLDTGIPIGGASTAEFTGFSPLGTPIIWAATPVNEADTTRLEYYTVDGDISESGKYRIQAHIIRGGLDVYGGTYILEIAALGY